MALTNFSPARDKPTEAVDWPHQHAITLDEFERMIAAGVWQEDEAIELIEGELIAMSPINIRHAAVVDGLEERLKDLLQKQARVRVQNPIVAGQSRPQPDISIVRRQRYAHQHPTAQEIFWLVEVSDTTARYDRERKVPIYAHAGIAEVWVVDLSMEQVWVYTQPERGAYPRMMAYKRGDWVSSAAFPEARVSVAEIFDEAED